ncbi:hypothetical protein [Corynebacterium riegelii]|uniref:Uncharacterized protein n=1 Tax=Corynebacterium riegelii TaxID=156976 RepID=A0A0K1RDF8_9CORY|nr:hypothetical protein [Corynebacterium riegelii]AKV59454.1 hypothetical protein AK829_10285 [Corynebacterium riegelii]
MRTRTIAAAVAVSLVAATSAPALANESRPGFSAPELSSMTLNWFNPAAWPEDMEQEISRMGLFALSSFFGHRLIGAMIFFPFALWGLNSYYLPR